MKNQSGKSGAGFTLIETLLYLGLFSIVIGGGMLATYGIIQGTQRGASQVAIAEEANFLLRKVDWMLTGVDSALGGVASPASGSSQVLTVSKLGVAGSVSLTRNGSNAELTVGSDPMAVLNSSSVKVTALSFVRTTATGQPDSIKTTFTISSSLSGSAISQDFEITKYLRQ